MLLVPTTDPGYSCTLINTLASHDTTASYYENIRVPASRRVGEENKGWRLITNQLNHERVTLAAHGTMAIRALHNVQRWAADTKLADGRRVIDLGWVRGRLARTHTRLDAMKLLNWQMVDAVQRGHAHPAGRLRRQGLRLRGPPGRLRLADGDRRRRRARSRRARRARCSTANWSAATARRVIFTFGGGNNEIQREIISWIGLGMPRVRR